MRNAASPFAARLFLSVLNLGAFIVWVHLIKAGPSTNIFMPG